MTLLLVDTWMVNADGYESVTEYSVLLISRVYIFAYKAIAESSLQNCALSFFGAP